LTVAGLLIMIWGWVCVGIQYGQPMTGEEAERFTGMKAGQRPEGGPAVEWSFKDMKAGLARRRLVERHVTCAEVFHHGGRDNAHPERVFRFRGDRRPSVGEGPDAGTVVYAIVV